MPSLRRTTSSPMVRASPYPATLSLSASGALNAGLLNRPRRVVSDTGRRRVLADIEWWRVLDGQHSEDNESEQDHGLEPEVSLEEGLLGVQPSVAATNNSVVSDTDGSPEASSLTTPFAALSISPMTPPRTHRARQASEASDSSDSSAESSPESSPRTNEFHDMLFMDNYGLDCTSVDAGFDMVPPPFLGAHPKSLSAMSMMRSVSFGGFDSPREAEDDRFGDVIFV
ncbi:hypothetical protein DFH11DRAFT_1007512 [Phellopilus nigrolimitatus]|nr:hypothetical protein DFH11DRAFT_1007512 [Phellopilus nigrolimitatus]